jgi:signal transduction histidine kinase
MKNEDLPKEKMNKYLGVIEEEANRLADMTTNMLNLSKVEKQEILTDCKKFNLSEQVRSSVLLLEKKWSKKRLKLDLDFDEYYVFANEDLLKQVWLNLIDNAIKFAYDKTPLVIKIEDSADETTVSISDRGEVIEKKELEKIFSKFYQAGQKKEGNGIGLSIVKHIVDLHEGKISVTSDTDSTIFTVTLPKKQ